MGAWGNRSCDCDDVQDELDNRFNLQGAGAYNPYRLNDQLAKVKGDTYNPTLLVGVVVGVLEVSGVEVSAENLERALAEAKNAVKDKIYIATWKQKKDRVRCLRNEIRQFQRHIKRSQS